MSIYRLGVVLGCPRSDPSVYRDDQNQNFLPNYVVRVRVAAVVRVCAVLLPAIASKFHRLWLLQLVLSPPQVHAGGLPVGSAAVPGEDFRDVPAVAILRVFDCVSERPCAEMLHSTVVQVSNKY